MCGSKCFGQTVTERIAANPNNCKKLVANSVPSAAALYNQLQFDSLQNMLQGIWYKCNASPEIVALQILLQIQQRNFTVEGCINRDVMQALQDIANRIRDPFASSSTDYYREGQTHLPLIKKWAINLKRTPGLHNAEIFVCQILAGEIRQVTQSIRQRKTSLPDLYSILVQTTDEVLNARRMTYGLVTGGWFPLGKASALGNHPTIGFQAGGRGKHQELLVNMYFKFMNTPRPIVVLRNGNYYNTNYFFGGYIGIDYVRYIRRWHRNELGAVAGIGWDGFDVFAANNTNRTALQPVSIHTININAGIKFHHYLHTGASFTVGSKYNIAPYKNIGGTALTGNVFTIDFGITLQAFSQHRFIVPL